MTGSTPAVRSGSALLAKRLERVGRGALALSLRGRSLAAALITAGALLASWQLARAVGGTDHVPPLWFYLPVLYAAAHFGCGGALMTSLAAGVMAGPLTPLDTQHGLDQRPLAWVTQLLFLVIVGQAMALVVNRARGSLIDELERLARERDVRRGAAGDEFRVHYQPIVDLLSGQLAGVEALARWRHPDRGLLKPEDFLPVAERSGLIVELGASLLHEACHQATVWRDEYNRRDLMLAVNISARQLAEGDLVTTIERVLNETGIEPGCLQLEVTETALIDDLDASAATLLTLRNLGVGVVIDDFGTGHSSLTYVQRLPIDAVKIDRSFTERLGDHGKGHDVTAAVIRFAHELDFTTVAEGVQNGTHIAELLALGCRRGQGYHFSPPLPPEHVGKLLAKDRPFVSQLARSTGGGASRS